MNEVPKSGYWTTWFVGLAMIGGAFLARHQMAQFEKGDKGVRLHAAVAIAHRCFGKEATFNILFGFGVFVMFVGVKDFRETVK